MSLEEQVDRLANNVKRLGFLQNELASEYQRALAEEKNDKATLMTALSWILANPRAHPDNIANVARKALRIAVFKTNEEQK